MNVHSENSSLFVSVFGVTAASLGNLVNPPNACLLLQHAFALFGQTHFSQDLPFTVMHRENLAPFRQRLAPQAATQNKVLFFWQE